MGKHLVQAVPFVNALQCLNGKVDNNNNNEVPISCPLFKHMCPLFTQHIRNSRIISTNLSTDDEKEIMEAVMNSRRELSGRVQR